MTVTISPRLLQRVAEASYLDTERGLLLWPVLLAGAAYFAYSQGAEDDFCLQSGSLDKGLLVLGGTNRLRWTPGHGFVPDRAYCTPAFLAHANRLGPLPGTVEVAP